MRIPELGSCSQPGLYQFVHICEFKPLQPPKRSKGIPHGLCPDLVWTLTGTSPGLSGHWLGPAVPGWTCLRQCALSGHCLDVVWTRPATTSGQWALSHGPFGFSVFRRSPAQPRLPGLSGPAWQWSGHSVSELFGCAWGRPCVESGRLGMSHCPRCWGGTPTWQWAADCCIAGAANPALRSARRPGRPERSGGCLAVPGELA